MLLTGDTISGAEAAAIGLVLEAVPADDLEEHVLALACRIANVGHDLLVHNQRIVNLGVQLMGRSQMQVLAESMMPSPIKPRKHWSFRNA